MAHKPSITVVGPGRLGSVLARAVSAAAFPIDEVVSRPAPKSLVRARALAATVGADAVTCDSARWTANVVWLCVRDGEIAEVAREISGSANWKGKVVLHSSGALASDEIQPLSERGASVASAHPMMSFVETTRPDLRGVTFAIEGDARAVRIARRIVRALAAEAISISKDAKSLYHAWGAFGSPLLIATLAAADEVARAAGLNDCQARRTLAPMLRQTIENYIENGAAGAFSGPLVRGDVATIERHLVALRSTPRARETYIALAKAALEFLPVASKDELTRVFAKQGKDQQGKARAARRGR